MRNFYENRQFRPAWLNAEGPRPQARQLVDAIDSMAAEGLDPRIYPKDSLNTSLREIEALPNLDDVEAQRRFTRADLSLTYTYFALASHLAHGRLQPGTLDIDWHDTLGPADLGGSLSSLQNAVREGGSVDQALHSATPASPGYAHLREAMARYEDIAAHGGWPVVGKLLHKGAQGADVTRLRARLAAEGDLPPSTDPATAKPADLLYDSAVAEGVTHFQSRHGLDPNGKVDAPTLAELDVPVQERIRQLQVNLERRRWLPADFGPRYIAVNIPDFRMKLVEDGQTSLEMKAIVGKAPHNQTPEFSGRMTFMVLNPSWNIPDDIVAKEIKPAMAKDPGYLARKRIEVTTVGSQTRWRALPGTTNPLGQVKFVFPNPYDVYLHDTPADSLFNASRRALSHGCIRLEKPLDLANALLRDDPKWTPDAVQDALATGESHVVSLHNPLPVHLLYLTAWVDDDGTVQFRRDVYGRDAKVAAALSRGPAVVTPDLGPGVPEVRVIAAM
ncbi:MAG TPA: L,D-transpeptidase family protein [Thermoanaerobaculia bacterium]|nr:L,D-transpeptidase family protein [Thermoanaerobaculia bacterium]